ncbi:MAG: DNA repair protein RecO [Candidatus Saccharimonadales bacterium]
MSSSYKTNGIILSRRDYLEADRIYTIITPGQKVSAIAKGIRKSNAKLASHLDLFAEIELMFVRGKSLDIITSARTITHVDISDDYDKLQVGFLFLEMVNKLTDTEDIGGVYDLLASHIQLLEELPLSVCELGFKLKLLAELGHKPDMMSPEGILESNLGLDTEHGKLVDVNLPLANRLDPDHIKLWRLLLDKPTRQVARVGGAITAAEKSMAVCDQFIKQQFGVNFRAKN